MFKKAFTLAEIMIVLAVIGILTAILMPIAFQSAPDENVLKFKKGNSTLGNVIREIVNSDQYYVNGDLSTRVIAAAAGTGEAYFCNVFAEMLTTKSVDCSSTTVNSSYAQWKTTDGAVSEEEAKNLDEFCKETQSVGAQVITTDGIIWYQASPGTTFDSIKSTVSSIGMLDGYKAICFDVDGLNEGEDPFAYGVRVDGKIQMGYRAKQWLNYSLNKDDE